MRKLRPINLQRILERSYRSTHRETHSELIIFVKSSLDCNGDFILSVSAERRAYDGNVSRFPRFCLTLHGRYTRFGFHFTRITRTPKPSSVFPSGPVATSEFDTTVWLEPIIITIFCKLHAEWSIRSARNSSLAFRPRTVQDPDVYVFGNDSSGSSLSSNAFLDAVSVAGKVKRRRRPASIWLR